MGVDDSPLLLTRTRGVCSLGNLGHSVDIAFDFETEFSWHPVRVRAAPLEPLPLAPEFSRRSGDGFNERVR